MRLPGSDATAWLDGRRTSVGEAGVPFDDAALHVGLGVFETIALRAGRLLDLAAHLDRLGKGAASLAIALPEAEHLRATLSQAAGEQLAPCAWLKIIVTRGGRWVVLTGPMDVAEEGRPVSAVLLPWRRHERDPLAGVKTTAYAHNELGLEEARRRGADEGLWRNSRGHVTEGCVSNLFVVHRRKLFTASIEEGILPGVVRERAMRSGRELGLPVHEGRLRVKRLQEAHEAFLTSSLCAVRPLIRIDGKPVGRGEAGPVTRAVAAKLAELRGLV